MGEKAEMMGSNMRCRSPDFFLCCVCELHSAANQRLGAGARLRVRPLARPESESASVPAMISIFVGKRCLLPFAFNNPIKVLNKKAAVRREVHRGRATVRHK